MRLRALAPGKVNLCLFVGGLRDDGRHEVATLIESVSLADQLTLDTAPGISRDVVVCPALDGPNLVELALGALRAHGWRASAVRIEIEKRIPVAGGMAGGSADAAAALRMALALGELADEVPGHQLAAEVVAEIAASLGADVPSQLAPGLHRATGAGERIEPRPPLAPHALVLVPLPFALRSADVYLEADRLGPPRSAKELEALIERLDAALARPSTQLPDELLVNDLESAAFSLCPDIREALVGLRAAGADHALVSGSGPTTAGLYWGADAHERAAGAASELAGRYPDAIAVAPVDTDYGVPRLSPTSGTI